MVLKSRLRAPDWSADGNPDREAKCRKHPLPTNHVVNADTDPFFLDQEEAAHVCNGTFDQKVCPFRARCLYGALVNNEQDGTWGGFTTEQRRWIRRQRYVKAPEVVIYPDDWEPTNQDSWREGVPTHAEIEEMNSALEEDSTE